ncbi:hypothetical protein SISNIDRAFT_487227 [Sistotremastrum niveocremeum HHB9708]|uniref:F-box domain-containing protein n=1 Tax=Sistotremastrum niveocremeum HHB9708 TaxID=1314777 RepID=A0A164SJT5_9AGAM|nr:hypothetical protein SISNIDRAFT_487227 [Sistotremastrum niveocremeum HHB9708]
MDSDPPPPSSFWTVGELVSMLMEFLDKKSLSACARVSKMISEHALDVLYRTGPEILDIIKLLCPEIQRAGEGSITQDITPFQWSRFRHYSSRIRILRHSGFGTNIPFALRGSICDLLDSLSPDGGALPLFPSLKKLIVEEDLPMRYPIILPLLHDGLKTLSLTLSHIDYCDLLGEIVHKAPNLERLSLRDGCGFLISGVLKPTPPTADAILSLSSLRSLSISSILLTPEVMEMLASRPRLSELSTCSYRFHIRHRNVSSEESIPFPLPKFPQLTELYISSKSLMGHGRCIFQASNLTALIVVFTDGTPAGAATELISASFALLKDLAIKFFEPRLRGDIMPPTLTREAIDPLLRLKFLEVLIIEHPQPPRVNDYDLGRVAISLPNLRCFQLCARGFVSAEYELPTLRCLLPFAQHCRKLKTFGISVDASDAVPPVHRAHIPFSHSLDTMILYSSKIGTETSRVVNFLASILPPHALLRHIVSPKEMFIEESSVVVGCWWSNNHFSAKGSLRKVKTWSAVAAALVLLRHGPSSKNWHPHSLATSRPL